MDQSLRTSNTIADNMGNGLGHSTVSTKTSPMSDVVALSATKQARNEDVQGTIPNKTSEGVREAPSARDRTMDLQKALSFN